MLFRSCFCHIDRHQWITNNVLLSSSRTWILSVLLVPDQHQVCGNKCEEDSRNKKDMYGVDALNENFAWECSTENEIRQVGTNNGECLNDGFCDADTCSGKKIIRE